MEGNNEQEETDDRFSSQEIVDLLRELADQGIDFDEQDVEHLSAMPLDEAMEYLITALGERGINPEPVLQRWEFIVGEVENVPEGVQKIQNRPSTTGEGFTTKEVDDLL